MSPLESNALCRWAVAAAATGAAATSRAATVPTSGPFELPTRQASVMLALVAIGLCVLAVWVVRRTAHPAKLGLAGTPGRPNSIHPAHILILLLVWLGSMVAVRQAARMVWSDGSSELTTVVNLAGQIVWLAASLLVAHAAFRNGVVRGMGLSTRHWIYDSARALLAYFAVIPVCVVLLMASLWVYRAIHGESPPEHSMLLALDKVSLLWQVVVIFSAVVMAPLSEEVFCRGLLQSMLRRYTGRPWAAVVLTAVVFSLMHLTDTGEGGPIVWTPALPLFALAVALGYNYERSGRLFAPILMHAIFNAVNVAVYLLG